MKKIAILLLLVLHAPSLHPTNVNTLLKKLAPHKIAIAWSTGALAAATGHSLLKDNSLIKKIADTTNTDSYDLTSYVVAAQLCMALRAETKSHLMKSTLLTAACIAPVIRIMCTNTLFKKILQKCTTSYFSCKNKECAGICYACKLKNIWYEAPLLILSKYLQFFKTGQCTVCFEENKKLNPTCGDPSHGLCIECFNKHKKTPQFPFIGIMLL